MSKYGFGTDFGDVIAAAHNQGAEKIPMSKDPNYLNRPAIPGAFESIKRLVELFGPDNAYIVSRCSKEGEQKIMSWLYYKSFWELTGMKRENIRFCRNRHEKGPICAELGITHFVDDRLECLVAMETVKFRSRLSSEPADVSMASLPAENGGKLYSPHSSKNHHMIFEHPHWSEIVREIIENI